jgi:hypothetical protein
MHPFPKKFESKLRNWAQSKITAKSTLTHFHHNWAYIDLELTVNGKASSNYLSLYLSLHTIILPVVLYGCETWSLTLKEECRLRVYENRVLRKIFGPKRDEVTREWRKLHNEELNGLYSLPNIVQLIKSRRMRWAGNVARMGKGEVCVQGFGGET